MAKGITGNRFAMLDGFRRSANQPRLSFKYNELLPVELSPKNTFWYRQNEYEALTPTSEVGAEVRDYYKLEGPTAWSNHFEDLMENVEAYSLKPEADLRLVKVTMLDKRSYITIAWRKNIVDMIDKKLIANLKRDESQ